MAILDNVKNLFKKQTPKENTQELEITRINVPAMEELFEQEDLVGAAKFLKSLLEEYGQRKKKNHRYKGREFIHFILSNKHKDLKNAGYQHWQNINQIIQLNYKKVYPYHKNNLRKAMDFFEKEVKSIYEIKINVM